MHEHEDKIIEAAFDLTAEKKWKEITPNDIQERTGLKKHEIARYISDRTDILALYNKRLDSALVKAIGEVDDSIPVKDRLFDVMMERFELMNKDRQALIPIIKSLDPDPVHIVSNMIRLHNSIVFMIELAGLKTSGLTGMVRQKGVKMIYLLTLRKWLEDESEDLSATMACLDQYLNRADQLARSFMPGA